MILYISSMMTEHRSALFLQTNPKTASYGASDACILDKVYYVMTWWHCIMSHMLFRYAMSFDAMLTTIFLAYSTEAMCSLMSFTTT